MFLSRSERWSTRCLALATLIVSSCGRLGFETVDPAMLGVGEGGAAGVGPAGVNGAVGGRAGAGAGQGGAGPIGGSGRGGSGTSGGGGATGGSGGLSAGGAVQSGGTGAGATGGVLATMGAAGTGVAGGITAAGGVIAGAGGVAGNAPTGGVSSGTGGVSGAGGGDSGAAGAAVTGGAAPIDPSPDCDGSGGTFTGRWTMDSGVGDWTVHHEGSATSSLEWTDLVGHDDPGALRGTYGLGAAGEVGYFRNWTGLHGDLTGKTIAAHVFVESGSDLLLMVYVLDENWTWADGGYVSVPPGVWTCIQLEIDAPDTAGDGFDPTSIVDLGVTLWGYDDVVVLVDDVWY